MIKLQSILRDFSTNCFSKANRSVTHSNMQKLQWSGTMKLEMVKCLSFLNQLSILVILLTLEKEVNLDVNLTIHS